MRLFDDDDDDDAYGEDNQRDMELGIDSHLNDIILRTSRL